jgi:hypothetical protein
MTPSERVAMVWPLTLQAWMFKEGISDEPRVRRDLVRTFRHHSLKPVPDAPLPDANDAPD